MAAPVKMESVPAGDEAGELAAVRKTSGPCCESFDCPVWIRTGEQQRQKSPAISFGGRDCEMKLAESV
jgi:hypothetical protein